MYPRVSGTPDQLPTIIKTEDIDREMVTFSSEPVDFLARCCETCARRVFMSTSFHGYSSETGA